MAPVSRTAERRRTAIKLLRLDLPEKDRAAAGAKTVAEVASLFSVSRESVRKWALRWQKGGEKALADSPAERGRDFAVTDGAARGLMAAAKQQKPRPTTLTEIMALARKRGITASRSALRRKLLDLGLWP